MWVAMVAEGRSAGVSGAVPVRLGKVRQPCRRSRSGERLDLTRRRHEPRSRPTGVGDADRLRKQSQTKEPHQSHRTRMRLR